LIRDDDDDDDDDDCTTYDRDRVCLNSVLTIKKKEKKLLKIGLKKMKLFFVLLKELDLG
jgi:hypothetical protein